MPSGKSVGSSTARRPAFTRGLQHCDHPSTATVGSQAAVCPCAEKGCAAKRSHSFIILGGLRRSFAASFLANKRADSVWRRSGLYLRYRPREESDEHHRQTLSERPESGRSTTA